MTWTRTKALAFRRRIEGVAESLDEEKALENIDFFPHWSSIPDGEEITVGKRLQHGGKLYEAIQGHNKQSDWAPDIVPALFKEVAKPGEIREITDPIPATSPFMKNEEGRWKGEVYVSLIDNNVWTPDAYPAGWQKK